ncbi:MAG: DedA family protein [bacterium]
MSSIFQNILGLILVYKYTALFLVAFLSSLGVPLPAGPSTMASAAFASQGYINIFLVIAMGTLGNILGDIAMYTLSKKYGKKILHFFNLGKFATSKQLDEVEKIENRYSALTIITSRFQDQATALVNILAGLGNMNFKRFLTYIIIGDIIQIMFYASIGYFFAQSWQSLYKTMGVFGWLVLLATVIIAVFAATKIKKRISK